MIGIYMIENKQNGKVYIGQSWDIEKRLYTHKNFECNVHLKRAFEKYGLDNFSFEVIKEFHEHPLTQIMLDSFEAFYIKQFDSMSPEKGYNRKGGGANGRMSEGTKKKISNSLKGRISLLKGKPSPKKGLTRSIESKTKQSKSTSGKPKPWLKGKTHSETHRRKNSESHKGKPAWNKGMSQTIEAKLKQSKTMRITYAIKRHQKWIDEINAV